MIRLKWALVASVLLAGGALALAQEKNELPPVRVSSGVIAGLLLERPDPVYPPEVRAAHVNSAMGTAHGQASAQVGLVPGQLVSCPGAEFPRRVSSGTMAGQLISRPDPIYPPEAIKAHVNGAVVMLACVGADGHVKSVAPISGPEMLRKTYMDAVSGWEYRPYLVDGKPVPVITTITISLQYGGG
jgi:protein TonB